MSEHGGDSDDHEEEVRSPHRGGHDSHEEGGHGEPWLVSYADMMTLLFGFFVIMYSFAAAKNADEANMIKIKKELAAYFGGHYINPATKVETNVEKLLAEFPDLKENTMIQADNEGLKIIISSQMLFDSGKAEIFERAIPIAKKLVASIGKDGKKYKIKVEGYTDSAPIHTAQFPSNWELSSARAIAFLKIFEEAGYDPEYLQAVGYGSTHPIVPNDDADGKPNLENRSKNRRVVIRVIPEDDANPQEPAVSAPNNEGASSHEGVKEEIKASPSPVNSLAQ